MDVLKVREPISAGLILSYKCTCECRHCMYACSPKWSNDWIDLDQLRKILRSLSKYFSKFYPPGIKGIIGLNYGLHLTGGEPFLRFDLLLRAVEEVKKFEIPSLFVETNCFWCVDDDSTRRRMLELKERGLDGILISANPFTVECVPFERVERGYREAVRIFGINNLLVYHPAFYRQFTRMGIKGTIKFEDYLKRIGRESMYTILRYGILLPMGRLVYKLSHLFPSYPAKHFFKDTCIDELTRPWHIHIDCYCNYIPGYCAGLSLGDAREIDEIVNGVELDDRPILRAISTNLGTLFELAVREFGYKERKEGYISKCHLCLDIRRHIASTTDEFKELQPREYYRHLLV